MPAHRKPLAALKESGTYSKNPGRYQSRLEAQSLTVFRSIGRPPVSLSTTQKKVWAEVVRIAPAGTLQRADRIALEMLVRIVDKVRTGTPTLAEVKFTQSLLSKFFMNPADRGRADLAPELSKTQKAADDAVFDELSELD